MAIPDAVLALKDLICQKADQYDVPRDYLAGLIQQESGGRVDATSFDGGFGRGLMQIDSRFHDYDAARMVSDPVYALDYGVPFFRRKYDQWKDGGYGQWRGWDAALAAYNGDMSGQNHYVDDVHRWIPEYAGWLAQPPGVPVVPVATGHVSPDTLIAAVRAHLGDVRETDPENGDHAVHLYCWAFVQDRLRDVGIPVAHYGSAREAGDAVTLSHGPLPAVAVGFWRGEGWSADDHVGFVFADGSVISALNAVQVTTGWCDLPSFRGWWLPDALVPPPAPPAAPVDTWFVDGNPYGKVPVKAPFWSRWDALNTMGVKLDHPGAVNGAGLGMVSLGYPVKAEVMLPSGRRIQQFERGVLATQSAPAPWDCVALLISEYETLKAKGEL